MHWVCWIEFTVWGCVLFQKQLHVKSRIATCAAHCEGDHYRMHELWLLPLLTFTTELAMYLQVATTNAAYVRASN